MRPLTLSCALFAAAATASLPAVSQSPLLAAANAPASAQPAGPAAAASPPVVLQAAGSPVAPTVAAAAWVLVDTLSGQTLGGSNADERRDPASLTKLMTA